MKYCYRPPYRTNRLPCPQWSRPVPEVSHRYHHNPNPFKIPVSSSLHHLTPVLTLVELIRQAGYRRKDDRLLAIDAMDVADHVLSDHRIDGTIWPFSLIDIIDSLRFGCGVGYLLPGEGEYERVRTARGTEYYRQSAVTSLRFAAVAASRDAIKEVLGMDAWVAVGVGITEKWHSVAPGEDMRVELPEPGARFIDGIAVVLTGWDDDREAFSFLPPLGEDWGGSEQVWIPQWYAVNPMWCPELIAITD